MPYISQQDRTWIDNELAEYQDGWEDECQLQTIADILRRVPSKKVKGAINYFVTRIVLPTLRPETGWGYTSLSEAVSVVRDVADEIQRRLLGPYEDKAIQNNGDISELAEIGNIIKFEKSKDK